ncbi:MAG: histidine kinase [Bacteroidota bacterium]
MMDVLKKYDDWNWERLSRHIIYWLAWSTFLVTINSFVGNVTDFADGRSVLWQWIAFEATVLPIKIGSAYTIAYVLMPRFLYQKRYLAFLLWGAVVLFFFAVLLYLVYAYFVHPIIFLESEFYSIAQFIYKGVELIYIAAMVVSIKFFQNYLHEQQRNQELVQRSVEAELKYLKNQVQPHFLFNTLNNIYGMVLSNDEHAGEAIVKLSNLLSFMLYGGEAKTVSLSKEVEMLDSFIELELLRYRRKLDFQLTKGNLSPTLQIAPLLLIPFVENAFKHGPAKEEHRSFIHIKMETQGSILHFSIENSFSKNGMKTENIESGIGLENIKKRLELLYPDQYTLEISERKTFTVSLMIELSAE